jgi:hypothetical protein
MIFISTIEDLGYLFVLVSHNRPDIARNGSRLCLYNLCSLPAHFSQNNSLPTPPVSILSKSSTIEVEPLFASIVVEYSSSLVSMVKSFKCFLNLWLVFY